MWKNLLMLLLAAGCVHFAMLAAGGKVVSKKEQKDEPVIMLSAPMGSEPFEPMRTYNNDGKRLLNNSEAW